MELKGTNLSVEEETTPGWERLSAVLTTSGSQMLDGTDVAGINDAGRRGISILASFRRAHSVYVVALGCKQAPGDILMALSARRHKVTPLGRQGEQKL